MKTLVWGIVITLNGEVLYPVTPYVTFPTKQDCMVAVQELTAETGHQSSNAKFECVKVEVKLKPK